jgi:hypothetical protein
MHNQLALQEFPWRALDIVFSLWRTYHSH